MSPTERAMRELLDNGVWPTAKKLHERPDLNGRECKLRERLAAEYGWVRVKHGRNTRWERQAKPKATPADVDRSNGH